MNGSQLTSVIKQVSFDTTPWKCMPLPQDNRRTVLSR